MSATISLTQTQIFTGLVSVLNGFGLAAAQPGVTVPIIRGQVNRVPEPNGQDFIVLWPVARDRLALNIETTMDTKITAAIASNVLTVTAVSVGPVAAGQTLYSTTTTLGCQIIRQLSGPSGGIGTYAVTPSPDYSMGTIYAGTIASMQETEITVQADVHGPASADTSARIQTLFRSGIGRDFALHGFRGRLLLQRFRFGFRCLDGGG